MTNYYEEKTNKVGNSFELKIKKDYERLRLRKIKKGNTTEGLENLRTAVEEAQLDVSRSQTELSFLGELEEMVNRKLRRLATPVPVTTKMAVTNTSPTLTTSFSKMNVSSTEI